MPLATIAALPDPVAYCKAMRMRFPDQYPTDLHLLLCMFAGDWEFSWQDGQLIDSQMSNHLSCAEQLTEVGWEHLRLAGRDLPPTSWPDLDRTSALLSIPDDISDEWLEFLVTMTNRVAKLGKTDMLELLRVTAIFSMVSRRDVIQVATTNFERFCVIHQACEEISSTLRSKSLERLQAKWRANNPEEAARWDEAARTLYQVNIGDTVSLQGGLETAKVIADGIPIGGQEETFCQLDHVLGLSSMWPKSALVKIIA